MPVKVNLDAKSPKPQPENMCLGCPTLCCKNHIVDVTTYDIFRLAAEKGKDMAGFVEWIYASREDAFGFRCEGVMVKLVMKFEKGSCVFLDEGRALSCTVEESKPSVCLKYPFSAERGQSVMRPEALCPLPNRMRADAVKMSPKVLEECDWELERFGEMVEDWNLISDGSENLENFVMFAANEMALESNPVGRAFRKAKRALLRSLFRPYRR
ncbi:MAG: YkgJ family cysteine cluster protein [Candidatus Micrarchaeota archaeon]